MNDLEDVINECSPRALRVKHSGRPGVRAARRGDGIHGFAFAFLVGVVAGTYSTVYIAAPVLLWLSGESAEMTTSPAK
jgi:hypothetical protein